MKRVLAVAAWAVLLLGIAACSDDSTSPPTSSTVTAVPSSSAAATTTASNSSPPASQPLPGTTTQPAQPTTSQQTGADGSTGNNLGAEYCARNQDPGCPLGSYVGPDAIPNPNGDGTWVPCEGTICTNPNQGAGPETTAPNADPTDTTPPNSDPVEGAACGDGGTWVHLDPGNAAHYGTEWMCRN